MGWRVLQLTKPCKLSVKNKQLLYDSDDNKFTIPIEDLSVVILDTGYVQLTGTLLSELANRGAVLFSCDSSHIPNGTFVPFHKHSRHSEIAHIQVSASEPLKKRIWQSIVKQKINNQAGVLKLFEKPQTEALYGIASRVQSGDVENSEGHAAAIYWKSMFENFSRRDDSLVINKALNYGYAILRGCVARSVVGSGLLPCFGVHHHNQLNQFNLVDDLIEAFRPFMDYIVASINFEESLDLSPELKNKLVSVLLYNCDLSGERLTILKAIEVSAASLARAFREKDASALKLPTLLHRPTIDTDLQ